MYDAALGIGEYGIGLALLLALAAGFALIGDRWPNSWRWLAALAQITVCALPFLLSAMAAALVYLPDRTGRAALAVGAGAAISALLFLLTWSHLRGTIRR